MTHPDSCGHSNLRPNTDGGYEHFRLLRTDPEYRRLIYEIDLEDRLAPSLASMRPLADAADFDKSAEPAVALEALQLEVTRLRREVADLSKSAELRSTVSSRAQGRPLPWREAPPPRRGEGFKGRTL